MCLSPTYLYLVFETTGDPEACSSSLWKHLSAEENVLLGLQKCRVVNVSSMVSLRALKNCSPELQQKFRSKTITEEELVGLMNKFVEDTKKGVHRKEGWPDTAYGVTKIGVTVLSRIHARNLSEQRRGDKILLNACCPGWVRTDMAGPRATKSPEEGAETPVYLALLPSDAEEPHGEFVMEKKVEKW
ncbi:carbonyl reductase [NADPH] 1-like [Ursus arctos]|uniref:carbonyl reductase [NADPH] 1-like n=1 Tax=Ursus arctos TaxID=9644 RepID=UPI002548BE0F|nr:carbonyl reductase [NADPH] 1-like [Ursus arctos]XP_057164153.1 carbonyl reductase [NADPH] 1-like [Ursus arctos]